MGQQSYVPHVKSAIRIVLVDDDLRVRSDIAQLLAQRHDFDLVGAFSRGRDALAAVADLKPDCLLVDVMMPGMNGVELTRLARAQHPGLHVLGYTSLASEEVVSQMLKVGGAGVVYKDAPIEALADAIRATMAGLSVLSPRYRDRLIHEAPDEPLTGTEVEVLHLVSRGWMNDRIGEHLGLSPSTIKYHIAKLTEKLGADNRVTLAVAAVRLGLDRSLPADQDTPVWTKANDVR